MTKDNTNVPWLDFKASTGRRWRNLNLAHERFLETKVCFDHRSLACDDVEWLCNSLPASSPATHTCEVARHAFSKRVRHDNFDGMPPGR